MIIIINNKTIDKERRKKDLKTILSQYEYYDVNMLTLRADVFGDGGEVEAFDPISLRGDEGQVGRGLGKSSRV